MVGGMLSSSGRRLGTNLHLGWVLLVLVALTELFSGLGHGGCQMLGINRRGLPSPEHRGVR
jgi:hypothetical protein